MEKVAVLTDGTTMWDEQVLAEAHEAKARHEQLLAESRSAEHAAADAYAQASEAPRRTNQEKNWDLPAGGYQLLLTAQGGVCKICEEPPLERNLVVDHDHGTGRIRGLLCPKCNFGLGAFKDDIVRLAGAMRYLAESRMERN